MLDLIAQYWWIGLILIFLLCMAKTKCYKEDIVDNKVKGFTVIFPKEIDFQGARVTVVSGLNYLTQYADIKVGKLHFNLPDGAYIDKVKIRTGGGKEYNYDKQKVPGSLLVDPLPCYDCTINRCWRK